MPKPFSLLIAVEQVALGPVMDKLHHMPGVVKVDMLLGDTKGVKNGHAKANGHAANKQFKNPDLTGPELLLKAMVKAGGHMKAPAMKAIFEKDGRSPSSYASCADELRKEGFVEVIPGKGGYKLTKKGRDKARYV